MSGLLFGSRLLITASTSPPIISLKVKVGGLSLIRYELGFKFVFGIEFAMFLPIVEKNKLNSLAIVLLSEVKMPLWGTLDVIP